jgi:acyl-CoA dehydrogenase
MDFFLNEEQKKLRKRVITLCKDRLQPLEEKMGEASILSRELVRELADAGLFRLFVPGEFGNSTEMPSLVSICVAREQLARYAPNAELVFSVQGLASLSIVTAGTPEQKKLYCPLIVSGEKIFALALTEPNAGSDVAAIETTAVSSGDDYLITGQKQFISMAPDADIYLVVAKSDPQKGSKGISAFLMEKGTAGFDPGPRLDVMAAHVIGSPKFKDCRVSKSHRIGEADAGFDVVMNTLGFFRCTVGAGAVGLAQRALEESISYAKKRTQFGKPISDFQAIRLKLAKMATELDAARLLVYRAAYNRDVSQKQVAIESSMAKLYATDAAQNIIDEAVQIHGGVGVVRGSVVERLYRQIRPMRVYEGTSEIQHLIIASALLKGPTNSDA